MIIKKEFKIEIYNRNIVLILADEKEELDEYVLNKYDVFSPDLNYEGFSINVSSSSFVICILKPFLSHNTLAHEIFHITEFVAQSTGIEEEEAMAWICGFITEHVYKIIKKLKIEILD